MNSASTLLRLSGNLSPRMICPAICAVAICAIVILCNDRDSGGAVFQVHQFWAPMHPVRLRREALSHAVDETRAIVHLITSLSSASALMSSSYNLSLKTSHPSQGFIKAISSKFPFLYFLAGFLAWGHPYGGHGIIKQGVFKVYPVSSPQAPFPNSLYFKQFTLVIG